MGTVEPPKAVESNY